MCEGGFDNRSGCISKTRRTSPQKQRADDYAPEDSSEDEEDEDEDGVPADMDGDFEFDKHVDLSSPFLCNILSDEWLVPNLEGVTAPTTAMYVEMKNREPTEEEWKNM